MYYEEVGEGPPLLFLNGVFATVAGGTIGTVSAIRSARMASDRRPM